MKTTIPNQIKTNKDAEKFLLELCENNEQYHPEDDALEILFNIPEEDQPTIEERKNLNNVMEQIYRIEDFDPCEYIMNNKFPEHNDII